MIRALRSFERLNAVFKVFLNYTILLKPDINHAGDNITIIFLFITIAI